MDYTLAIKGYTLANNPRSSNISFKISLEKYGFQTIILLDLNIGNKVIL